MIKYDSKNTAQLITNLQQLHRSSYPVAVRETLNSMAFDTKSKNLLPTADKIFTVRNQNYFRRFSRVDRAKGFNTRSMVAKVGMLNDEESKNFNEQEQGGSISRGAIQHDEARISKNRNRRISTAKSKERYLSNISRQKNAKNGKRSRKSNFVAGAYMAYKHGTMLYYGQRIYKVTSFKKLKSGEPKFKILQLYNIERGRNVSVKPTKFIQRSSEIALKQAEKYFVVQANKQFKKYFK